MSTSLQMRGRTIRLFLVDGTPSGVLTAEILNWTGKAMSGPRSKLPDLVKRDEASRPGVYFLYGLDPSTGEQIVYIGEGDDVGERLIQHNRDLKKVYWTNTCLFVSKDENLTKIHVRYLESRLLSLANEAARSRLDNSQTGMTRSLPEAELADMEFFIEQIRIISPLLGLDVFRSSHINKLVQDGVAVPEFELRSPKLGDVHAQAVEVDGEFLVKAGSTARLQVDQYATNTYGKLRDQLIAAGKLVEQDGRLSFVEDVPFSSPSAASATIFGRNDNGRTSWKLKGTHQSYSEWQQQLVEAGKRLPEESPKA